MPVGMFSPSAKTVTFSARPSPSVSSRTLTRSRPGAGGLARVLDALGDPDPPAVVERHRDRVDDVRLAGDQLDREALGHGHLGLSFGRRIRLVRRGVLAVGDHVVIGGECWPYKKRQQEKDPWGRHSCLPKKAGKNACPTSYVMASYHEVTPPSPSERFTANNTNPMRKRGRIPPNPR